MQSISPRILALTALIALFSSAAYADGAKIAFINSERVVREAPASILASKNIEAEFSTRQAELQHSANELAEKQKYLADQKGNLPDNLLRSKENEIKDLSITLERRQREFREDLQARQMEATSGILEKANEAIRRLAKKENLDMVIQDAVSVSQGVDITDRVLKLMAEEQ